jgi:hypothetical protein
MREVDFETVNNLLKCGSDGILIWKSNGKIAGSVDRTGYIRICIRYKKYSAADVVWLLTYGVWPSTPLDHKDTIRKNNAPENLREASIVQQLGNRKTAKHNKLGVKGVSKANARIGYCARIVIDRKYVHLGTFSTVAEAHNAYLRAAKRHFGEFARGE